MLTTSNTLRNDVIHNMKPSILPHHRNSAALIMLFFIHFFDWCLTILKQAMLTHVTVKGITDAINWNDKNFDIAKTPLHIYIEGQSSFHVPPNTHLQTEYQRNWECYHHQEIGQGCDQKMSTFREKGRLSIWNATGNMFSKIPQGLFVISLR